MLVNILIILVGLSVVIFVLMLFLKRPKSDYELHIEDEEQTAWLEEYNKKRNIKKNDKNEK